MLHAKGAKFYFLISRIKKKYFRHLGWGKKNHLHGGKESVGLRLLLKNTQCQKATQEHILRKRKYDERIILSRVVLVKKQKGGSLKYEKKNKGKSTREPSLRNLLDNEIN